MIWNGVARRSGARGPDPNVSSAWTIDLPDHGRPQRSDVGDHLAPYPRARRSDAPRRAGRYRAGGCEPRLAFG